MSLDFYDSKGQPYAYSDDGEAIYTFGGKPVGYIFGDSIYSFSGAHLGFYENGQIWDHGGGVVLFTSDASGGPMKPLKKLKPLKSLKALKPLKSVRVLKPINALRSMNWSTLSPVDFFGS